jgi:hypothetical protein
LWRPVQIGDNSIGSVVRISEGDSVRQDIMARSTSTEQYLSRVLSPSLKISSIMSPSPWSSTFSRNFEERLKKSVKLRDFITVLS